MRIISDNILWIFMCYLWLNIGLMFFMSILKRSNYGRIYIVELVSPLFPLMYVPDIIEDTKEKMRLKKYKTTRRVYDTTGKLVTKKSHTKHL